MVRSNIYEPGTIKPKSVSQRCGCELVEGVEGCNDESCLNRMMYTECNPRVCAYGKNCRNARIQRRQFIQVKPVWKGPKGWGLITNQDVRKFDLIMEYNGDIIGKEKKEQRLREGRKTKNFYLMSLNTTETIDGTERANLSRFINHSCEPNCRTEKWNVNGSERIALFALKDIPKGTELSYDYFGNQFSETNKVLKKEAESS